VEPNFESSLSPRPFARLDYGGMIHWEDPGYEHERMNVSTLILILAFRILISSRGIALYLGNCEELSFCRRRDFDSPAIYGTSSWHLVP
jgi:hypothetical protein